MDNFRPTAEVQIPSTSDAVCAFNFKRLTLNICKNPLKSLFSEKYCSFALHNCWISSLGTQKYAVLENSCPNDAARSVGGVFVDQSAFDIFAFKLSGESGLMFTCEILAYEDEALYSPPECVGGRGRRDVVVLNPRIYLLPEMSAIVTLSDRFYDPNLEKSGKIRILESSLALFFLLLIL